MVTKKKHVVLLSERNALDKISNFKAGERATTKDGKKKVHHKQRTIKGGRYTSFVHSGHCISVKKIHNN